MEPPELSRDFVRKQLMKRLPTDADLDAFISDYFPDVYQRFSMGMQRIQKVSLLLDSEPEREQILEKLYERSSQRNLLRGSVQSLGVNKFLLGIAAGLLVALGAALSLLARGGAPVSAASVPAPLNDMAPRPAVSPRNEVPLIAEPQPAVRQSDDGISIINSSRININGRIKTK